MQMLYDLYYRQFGLRRIQNLFSPRLFTLGTLPRNTMLHYLSTSKENRDLDISKHYFTSNSKKIMVDYPEELTSFLGTPIRVNKYKIRFLTLDFHNKNRQYRYLKDHYSRVADEMAIYVENYSYIDKFYKYVKLPLTEYYDWFNTNKTIWDNVNRIQQETDKNHFFFIDVPSSLPSLQILNMASNKMTLTLMKVFDTNEELFLLQLWKWLSVSQRDSSIFASLSDEALNKVNLVFTVPDGRSCLINMGTLNSWIQGSTETKPEGNITQVKPFVMQKLILSYFMKLSSLTIEDEVEEAIVNNEPTEIVHKDEQDSEEELELEQEQEEIQLNNSNSNLFALNSSQRAEKDLFKVSDLKANLVEDISSKKPKEEIKDLDNEDSLTIENQLKDIDKDIDTLNTMFSNKLKERGLRMDTNADLSEVSKDLEELSLEDIESIVYTNPEPEEALKNQLGTFADYGMVSAPDYRKILTSIEDRYKSIDPYGSEKPLKQMLAIAPSELKLDKEKITISSSTMVQDKSMLESSLLSYDSDYIKNVMSKDVLSMIDTVQKAGVLVKKHEVEIDEGILGTFENHTLEIKPIDGVASTLRFRLPRVNSDGTFTSNGNKLTMRKQRVDLPIRKIAPSIVALSSYYGKTFVSLSPKKANSSTEFIIRRLTEASLMEHPYIRRVDPANVFDNNFKAPFIYNALANNFKSIITDDFTLVFDYTERANLVKDPELLKQIEIDGIRVVGYTDTNKLIYVDKDNLFHVYGDGTPGRSVFEMLQFNQRKAPVDFSEVRIYSKPIPVAIILGYSIGLKNLLKLLKVNYKVVENKKKYELEDHEYYITFKDQSYVISRKNVLASNILGGFLEYEKIIKSFESEDFDSKDIYLNLLESKGLGSVYIREIDLTQQLFVDSITKGILEEMKEPVTFNGLLIRATEMLDTYHHPDSQDTSVMRVRGYERFSGVVYKELTTAIRKYRNKNISGKSRVEMSPYQVWSSLTSDNSIKIVDDTNPIQNLKENEIVTYVGEGGRSKEGINKKSRAYHENDMGVISEATVDSSDVGVNAYLSANPKFLNMRGMIDPNQDRASSNILSTSVLLSPEATRDEAKRAGFISIQHTHTIPAKGYRQPQVKTGYEYIIANRTSDLFAFTAKDDGKVLSIAKDGIVIQYKDGTTVGSTLGIVYGKAGDSRYPYNIISDLKEGQKFSKGDAVSYNEEYFEKDLLDPSRIVMKNSMTCKVALYESKQTHEDSCSVNKRLSDQLTSKTTKVKSYVVDFKQALSKVLGAGKEVGPKDILMYIEDEITATAGVFNEDSLELLKRLGKQAPRAGLLGVIDKIEVYYNGDKQDMSPSLRYLVDKSDKVISESNKAKGSSITNGRVSDNYSISGSPLTMDKAEIKFYITQTTDVGIGDKLVFGLQLKSTVGEVMDYDMHTEEGVVIDAVFGMRSIMARVVNSPMLIGTTTTLLNVIAQKAVSIYKS